MRLLHLPLRRTWGKVSTKIHRQHRLGGSRDCRRRMGESSEIPAPGPVSVPKASAPTPITIERAVKAFLDELRESAAWATHKKYRLLLDNKNFANFRTARLRDDRSMRARSLRAKQIFTRRSPNYRHD